MIWPMDYRYLNNIDLGANLHLRCDWCASASRATILLPRYLQLENSPRKLRPSYACPHCAIKQPWRTNAVPQHR